jgi:hypothetical protein
MIKVNEQMFLTLYFSGFKVEATPYVPCHLAYLWTDEVFDGGENGYVYLVSPETKHNYLKFIENMKKETPLLLELK